MRRKINIMQKNQKKTNNSGYFFFISMMQSLACATQLSLFFLWFWSDEISVLVCVVWVCLLFLLIIIKQRKTPAVVANNRVVVLSPVSACAEELAHWPECQAAVVVGGGQLFVLVLTTTWVSHINSNTSSEIHVFHWGLFQSFDIFRFTISGTNVFNLWHWRHLKIDICLS